MNFKTKKQKDRFANICPNGTPKKIRCYDNGGKTLDRYTVVFTGNYRRKTNGVFLFLGMSENPQWGIGSRGESLTQIDTPAYSHLGYPISFDKLPDACQRWVKEEYLCLWEFTDEDNNPIG